MTKWEYCTLSLGVGYGSMDKNVRYSYLTFHTRPIQRRNLTSQEEYVNIVGELGQEGWELVAVVEASDQHLYFKRPA